MESKDEDETGVLDDGNAHPSNQSNWWFFLLCLAIAGVIGAAAGIGGTLWLAERGPEGPAGDQGPMGVKGEAGEDARNVSADVDDLQSQIYDLQDSVEQSAEVAAESGGIDSDVVTDLNSSPTQSLISRTSK